MRRNDPEFNKLKNLWYKKLKKSGFEDIEQDEDILKSWSLFFPTHQKTSLSFESSARYYQLAGQFLHSHKFQSSLERFVWKCHSEGMSRSETVKACQAKGFTMYKNKFDEIIGPLKEIMVKNATSEVQSG